MSALEELRNLQPIVLPSSEKEMVREIVDFRPRSDAGDLAVFVNDVMRRDILYCGVRYVD